MKAFRLSPDGRGDIESLWLYIARDNPKAATRVTTVIRDACRHLAEFPNAGHKREDLTTRTDVLFWPIYSFLIVYRPTTQPLQIVRVLHGNRDVSEILDA